MDISLKRALAYIIDMLLILFVVSFLRTYTGIDPYKDKYEENLEKYNELVEKLDGDNEYNDELVDLNIEINRCLVVNNIMTMSGLLLYFGLYEWLGKGKTLGKKLMDLKVTSKNNTVKPWQSFLRVFVIGNMIFTTFAIIFNYALTGKTYIYSVYILQLIEYAFYMTNILMMVLRKDHRGIHDILSKTTVVEDKSKEIFEEKVIEEPKKEESIKEKVEKKEKKKTKKAKKANK